MNSTVLLDHQRFDEFLENQEIDAYVVTPVNNQSDFKVNDIIEVWHKPNSSAQNELHLAIIVRNLGASMDPYVLKIKVQKIGNLN